MMDTCRAGGAAITRKRVGLASGAAAEFLCLASYLKSVRLRRTRVQSGGRKCCERRVRLRRAAPRAARAAFAPQIAREAGRQLEETPRARRAARAPAGAPVRANGYG